MATYRSRLFLRQTWTLTKKILLVAVVRHWPSTLFRSMILPIAYIILLLNIKNFLGYNNSYGVGSAQPVHNLLASIPDAKKLAFVQPPDLGPDVDRVVTALATPLQNTKQLVYLTDQNDLLTTCRENLHGITDCFAAIIFNDSPLTAGKNGIWNYTIRADSKRNGYPFHAEGHNNDEELIYLPLQVALENAITNSTIIPNEYMFTSLSPAAGDELMRQQYQHVVITSYGVAFLISLTSGIYHLVAMATSERESGMTQLIDAMGGSPAARICSYVLAFDLIYLPCWIVFGVLIWAELFRTSSVLISLFWQILTGMALTSASIFTAMFFNRAQLSGIFSVIGFLLIGLGGQIINNQSPATPTVTVLSLLFPSMNYMFMLGYICRYEGQDLPTNLLRAANSTHDEPSTSRLPGILLWLFLALQVIAYPALGAYVERWMHGTKYKDRTVRLESDTQSSLIGVETVGLTKIYQPTFRQKWFTRGKVESTVAVKDLNLVARMGQILCLLGANGSGKTTTLDMIGGLQKATKGSIHVGTTQSHIGICPQHNILWNDLTVEEHVKIWKGIKHSSEDVEILDNLIESCDLSLKKNAKAGSLSGGQKRKLQLACMLVGGSSLCLLDEVTSGLDPLSRRAIWSIILAERSKRTMILTTHFLDEAEVLADHIAIISRGLLMCEGSAVELKMRLGKGYKIRIPAAAQVPDMGFPTRHLQNEIVYEIPDSATAASTISRLERMGHSDIIVNGPTIEDVFLGVADEAQPLEETDITGSERHTADNAQPVEPMSRNKEDEILTPATDISPLRQTQVLFLKRCKVLIRNWWAYLIVLIIPIASTPPLIAILKYYSIPSCLDVNADVHAFQPFNIPYASRLTTTPLEILVGPNSINETLYNVVATFPVGSGLNIQNYSNQFIFEESIESFQNHVATLYANISLGALFMDNNFSVPTYAYIGDSGVLPAMLIQNLWTQIRAGIPIAGYFAPFNSLISPSAGSSVGYISYFCLAQAVYPALFALYPSYEKTRGVRALQYSNGVRTFPLWCAHMLFDFIFIIISSTICTVIIARQAPGWFEIGYFFPILLLYGLSGTAFGYVISIFASSQLATFAFAAGIQGVMFIISILAFTLIEAFGNTSHLQLAIDATTFVLNLFFPIGNVMRAMLVGLNVDVVGCRNDSHISYGGSIYAYGGPILYLCIQVCFYLWLLLWIEGVHVLPAYLRNFRRKNTERAHFQTSEEVEDEKARVEQVESDLLRILHVTKSFGLNIAVEDVSFGVSQGEILALLGPNGAGKSTIINMIRGQLVPDKGMILLRGTDIVKDMRPAQKYLGVCPQFDALDLMTTREHLEFYGRAKGVSAIERDVDLVMRKIGLKAYENCLASKLSGGNRRKLSLAIALIGNPPIILLDEPSSSMDAVSKRFMWKTLAEVSVGRSLLVTTHSMEEAAALATRAAIISRRILTLGTIGFLCKKYGNAYHVHMVLKSAPTSTRLEMENVESWVLESFSGARLDPFGNYHGQIKFSIPAKAEHERDNSHESNSPSGVDAITLADGGPQRGRNIVAELFNTLEKHKEAIGLEHYSVGATTLDDVFLNVVRENNVREEDSALQVGKGRRFLICV